MSSETLPPLAPGRIAALRPDYEYFGPGPLPLHFSLPEVQQAYGLPYQLGRMTPDVAKLSSIHDIWDYSKWAGGLEQYYALKRGSIIHALNFPEQPTTAYEF